MLLKFENLTIRSTTTDDAEQLAAWWNDGAVMAHAGFPNGTGESPEEIADSLKNDSDDTGRRLMIELDQVPVGEMNYRNIGTDTAEIGIKLCDFSVQDKGFGKKLLSMLISSLFNDLGYRKIILDTNLDNKRAQHVYEKLGFRKLRVLKNSWKNQLGEWQSSVDYELFPEDFVNFAK
ncbi:MAG: GNAT family N-acetyltransferase [Lachnospiraceae bacterium]|nr:GNAT family N-acetyltransferase [Lachnospiraceae bacterium]